MKLASRLALMLLTCLPVRGSFETEPVRPTGGDFVPAPYQPVALDGHAVGVFGRSYDLSGIVPLPKVGEQTLLRSATVLLSGATLAPTGQVDWRVKTPAVGIGERSWHAGPLSIGLTQTVEYDGFITVDLTLTPPPTGAEVQSLSLDLAYRPEASLLYQSPTFRPTFAGFWPEHFAPEQRLAGVWGGHDTAGFAVYFGSRRDWSEGGETVKVVKGGDGVGHIIATVIAEPRQLTAPVSFRFGFIATPVRPPESTHLQFCALSTGGQPVELAPVAMVWSAMSDHYATFRTNDPAKDEGRRQMVAKIQAAGQPVIAYTTYDHVEEPPVEPKDEWRLLDAKLQPVVRSIGGGMADRNRAFLTPGSADWIDWKLADLKYAIDHYGLDGFYIDTSYLILPAINPADDLGWQDSTGAWQGDFQTWSMREVWRRSWEQLVQLRGQAVIYAHHKSGCPPALAAWTTAFCEGEQYTGQSIRNLTLDAFRAQVRGTNFGPRGILLNEFYRSKLFGMFEQSQHHNPLESVMLALVHDRLITGMPGNHPAAEIIALRDDLQLATAEFTPYFAEDAWRLEGVPEAVVSAWRNAAGETVLVAGNPTFEPVSGTLAGPRLAAASDGRTLVAIQVDARVGRSTSTNLGYRWEPQTAAAITVPARSFQLLADVTEPDAQPQFAAQRGFFEPAKAAARKQLLPADAVLLSDGEDPDWVLANDDGSLAMTDDAPQDTSHAMRVVAKPHHSSAALLLNFAEPRDWREIRTASLWVRPVADMPVSAFDLKLRNVDTYGPSLKLTSPAAGTMLPAGKWTKLEYVFGDIPREQVRIFRIYYNRGEQCPAGFSFDEVMVHGAAKTGQGTQVAPQPGGAEDQPIAD